MPEYEYPLQTFTPDETVDVPAEAVGATVSTFGNRVSVRYLVPVGEED